MECFEVGLQFLCEPELDAWGKNSRLNVLQVYPCQVSDKNVKYVEFISWKYAINSKWMLCIALLS